MVAKDVLYALVRHIESKANGDQFTYIPEFNTPEGRRLDLLVIANWASHDYVRTAYEIKVTKSDFNSEMKDGSKTDSMLHCANFSYFVVPKGLVKVEEVPVNCGLIEVTPKGCSYAKKAPKNPVAIHESKHFYMSMMTQAQRRNGVVKNILASGGDSDLTLESLQRAKFVANREGYKKGFEEGKKTVERSESLKINELNRVIRQAIGVRGYGELTKEEKDMLYALKDHSPVELRNLRDRINQDLTVLLRKYQ